jgi:uncharacterized membrane protein
LNRRLAPLALAASLAGNLFLGGLILGSKLRGGPEDGRGAPQRSARLADVSERLDPAEADALRNLLRERSEQAEPRLAAIRAARREVDAVMAQPSYDQAAARQALARVRAEEAALRGEVDEALLAFAVRLDPEERACPSPLAAQASASETDGPTAG